MDHAQDELSHEHRPHIRIFGVIPAQHRPDALAGDDGALTSLVVPAQSFRASRPST